MTDEEAEALALEEAQAEVTRLNAIWGLEFTPYFHPGTQTYRFYATIEAGVEDDSLSVWVKETSITIRTDFAGYGLTAKRSGLIDEHSTRREEGGVEFIITWLDYFRRGCWLSGCLIEATAHEKMEWIQSLTHNANPNREPEVLSEEQFKFRMAQIAAAFGVEEWHYVRRFAHYSDYAGEIDGVLVWCRITNASGVFQSISLGDEREECGVVVVRADTIECEMYQVDEGMERFFEWELFPELPLHHLKAHLMARGLYCLGFDDPYILAKLNSPLSAREKMELRLAMPREFWPQKWKDEASE